MKRILCLIAMTAFCLTTVSAARAAKGETVTYKSGNDTVSAFLATPDHPGRYPGLVVIHEWWGLTPWVKGEARKFADHGYVALAVDLYRGKVTSDPKQAAQWSSTIPQDRAVRDLKAAYAYLASRPDVESTKIGSVGWCFGGGFSLELAENEPHLAACIVNYGATTTDPAVIDSIHAPVLGNYGLADQVFKPAEVRKFEAAMRKAGKPINIKFYPGAPHAFENPGNKTGYRPKAAADAWSRMIAFLHQQLM
jgi:carboxymethylenebutenolidase